MMLAAFDRDGIGNEQREEFSVDLARFDKCGELCERHSPAGFVIGGDIRAAAYRVPR
jgi:hypothetical protein